MFSGCSGLESVTIPDTITNIEARAFSWCSALTSIAIPVGVTHVGCGAFDNCPEDLFDIETIPGIRLVNGWVVDCDWNAELAGELDLTGTRGVADDVFLWCSGLTSVSIPTELVAIGAGAFSGCSSLSAFVVSDDNPRYEARGGVLFSKDGSVLVCCPAAKSGSYAIPDSVTHIEREAFYGCSKLTSITIPDSVASVGENAFSSCNLLTNALYNQSGTTLWRVPLDTEISFAIPDGVTFIGDYAFSECYNLTLLAIPTGVKRIGDGAFDGCSALTMVSIPDGVERIGDGAFENCEKLNRITFLGTASGVSPSAFPSRAYSEWEDFAAAVPARLDGNLAEMGLDGVSTNLYDEADLHELDVRLAREGEVLRNWTIPVVSGATYTCSVPDLSEFDGAGYRYDIPETESIDVLVAGNETVTFDHWTTNVLLQLNSDRDLWFHDPQSDYYTVSCWLGATRPSQSFYTFLVYEFGEIIPGSFFVTIGNDIVVEDDGTGALVSTNGSVSGFVRDGVGWIAFPETPPSGMRLTATCNCRNTGSTTSALVEYEDGSFSPAPISRWMPLGGGPLEQWFWFNDQLNVWWLDGDADGVTVESADNKHDISIPADRPRTVTVRVRGIDELVEIDCADGLGWINGPVLYFEDDSGGEEETFADAGWRLAADPTADDGYSLRSEEINAGKSAAIRLSLEGAGTLSFDWRISNNDGHFARFYLDGVKTNELSRSTAWQSVQLAVGDGPHVLQWSYEKGMTAEAGEDAAFLDNVRWSPVTLQEALDAPNLCWTTESTISLTVTTVSCDPVVCTYTTTTTLGSTQSETNDYRFLVGPDIVPGSLAVVVPNQVCFHDLETNGVLTSSSPVGTCAIDYATGLIALHLGDEIPSGVSIVAYYRYWLSETIAIISEPSQPEFYNRKGWGWFAQITTSSDGTSAARSPEIASNETSRLSTTVLGPGTLAWKWKADMAGSAGVKVYLDGEDLYDDGIKLEGNSGWTDAMLEIESFGNHAIAFEYWNAGTTNTLSDCAYIDQVSWTPSKPESVIAEGVEVPVPWIDETAFPFVETAGGDYETAAKAMSANGVNKVWECYVAGLSPTNATERFEARIKFENGEPVVTWNPDLGASRDYIVEGKETLGDGWGPTNAASRFFRVKVKLP